MIIHCFSEVMVLLCLAAQINLDNAAFQLWRKEYPIARLLQVIDIQCFSEVMAMLWLVARMVFNNACFHFLMKECPIARLLQVIVIQCFSEVTALLWLLVGRRQDNATFHLWMKERLIPRFLQVIFIQCFCEVMAALWHLVVMGTKTDNATFLIWMKECPTLRFLQAIVILCSSEVMAMLWLVARMILDSATFHLWMKACPIAGLLQVIVIQCFSEVMAVLLPVAWINMVNATSRPSSPGFHSSVLPDLSATSPMSYRQLAPVFECCNWSLRASPVLWCWHATLWLGMRCCTWNHMEQTWPRICADKLPDLWPSTPKGSAWCCPMDSCWPRFAGPIQQWLWQIWAPRELVPGPPDVLKSTCEMQQTSGPQVFCKNSEIWWNKWQRRQNCWLPWWSSGWGLRCPWAQGPYLGWTMILCNMVFLAWPPKRMHDLRCHCDPAIDRFNHLLSLFGGLTHVWHSPMICLYGRTFSDVKTMHVWLCLKFWVQGKVRV